jgi:hypothetical protein
MNYFLHHRKIFGSILLAFVFLTSSGFTVVVSHCTMAAVPSCCADMQNVEMSECSDAPAVTTHSIYGAEITCHVNTVVSSLNTTPATVEKSSLSKIFNSVSSILFLSGQLLQNSPASLSFTTHVPQHTSPPSVEKQVLLSSFLI